MVILSPDVGGNDGDHRLGRIEPTVTLGHKARLALAIARIARDRKTVLSFVLSVSACWF
jgi:hypothetical protein